MSSLSIFKCYFKKDFGPLCLLTDEQGLPLKLSFFETFLRFRPIILIPALQPPCHRKAVKATVVDQLVIGKDNIKMHLCAMARSIKFHGCASPSFISSWSTSHI